MEFKLETGSGVPIYVQLKEQIKQAVWQGKFAPGAQLPTVRQLAVSLRINPNTVSRVYSELEKDGVLATRQGRGTFVRRVSGREGRVQDNYGGGEERLDRLLQEMLWRAEQLGFDRQQVVQRLAKLPIPPRD